MSAEQTAPELSADLTPRRVPLSEISFDVSLQTRVADDLATIERYCEGLARGVIYPAIEVFRPLPGEGEKLFIGDGRHRGLAHAMQKLPDILAIVREGGRLAALRVAFRANEGHGLRRTNADRHKTIRMYLLESDWYKHSPNMVAEACDVDRKTVSVVRAQLIAEGKIPEVTEYVGADDKVYPVKRPRWEIPRSEATAPKIRGPQPDLFGQAAATQEEAGEEGDTLPARGEQPKLSAPKCDDPSCDRKTWGLSGFCEDHAPPSKETEKQEVTPEKKEPTSKEERSAWSAQQEANRIERHAKIAAEAKAAQKEGQLGPFSVLYVDPPWRYGARISEAKSIEAKYPTLSLDELCALDVASIAWKSAVLYLWVTVSHAMEAGRLLDAWGFEYKTQHVWIKERKSPGMGHWVRGDHELLYVAVKGKFPTPPTAERDRSALWTPIGEHSEKPAEMRQLLEEMYPGHPKVELFARSQAEGWVSIGNKIDGADIRELLRAGVDRRQAVLPGLAEPPKSAAPTNEPAKEEVIPEEVPAKIRPSVKAETNGERPKKKDSWVCFHTLCVGSRDASRASFDTETKFWAHQAKWHGKNPGDDTATIHLFGLREGTYTTVKSLPIPLYFYVGLGLGVKKGTRVWRQDESGVSLWVEPNSHSDLFYEIGKENFFFLTEKDIEGDVSYQCHRCKDVFFGDDVELAPIDPYTHRQYAVCTDCKGTKEKEETQDDTVSGNDTSDCNPNSELKPNEEIATTVSQDESQKGDALFDWLTRVKKQFADVTTQEEARDLYTRLDQKATDEEKIPLYEFYEQAKARLPHAENGRFPRPSSAPATLRARCSVCHHLKDLRHVNLKWTCEDCLAKKTATPPPSPAKKVSALPKGATPCAHKSGARQCPNAAQMPTKFCGLHQKNTAGRKGQVGK